MKKIILSLFVFFACTSGVFASDEIKLIVRADDMGYCQTSNTACIQSWLYGIATSIEVIVPGPWFNEAAEMLNRYPDIDVGVHLCLTSEWELLKWGPVTNAPSLVDAQGHFFPMTRQRRDFPPNTGFVEARPDPDEVEQELRAQIELALKKIKNVTHLSAHMGTAVSTPEVAEITRRLAREYNLPLAPDYVKPVRGFGGGDTTAQEKEDQLVKILEGLQPGVWMLVDHPGLETEEQASVWHKGYENVMTDRAGVTYAFTSRRVIDVVRKRGIQLIGYKDLFREN